MTMEHPHLLERIDLHCMSPIPDRERQSIGLNLLFGLARTGSRALTTLTVVRQPL
jgi:hypothetical protein